MGVPAPIPLEFPPPQQSGWTARGQWSGGERTWMTWQHTGFIRVRMATRCSTRKGGVATRRNTSCSGQWETSWNFEFSTPLLLVLAGWKVVTRRSHPKAACLWRLRSFHQTLMSLQIVAHSFSALQPRGVASTSAAVRSPGSHDFGFVGFQESSNGGHRRKKLFTSMFFKFLQCVHTLQRVLMIND